MADDPDKCEVCGQATQDGSICNRAVCGRRRIIKTADGEIEIPPKVHRLRLAVNNG